MNELESDKQNLKRGASNFEKQKNESKKKTAVFFVQKKTAVREWMSISPLRSRGISFLEIKGELALAGN